MTDILAQRRHLLLAALPLAMFGAAQAETLNPTETIITLPDNIPWQRRPNWPDNSVISAPLFGHRDQPGLYYELIKWYPGYMSAPHTYVTDRLCVVVSGTWWVNSGADFDPRNCRPVPAGSFVRRVAHTPHYDGVIAAGREPVIIAICGIAPVQMHYIEPNKPGWRHV
jgi:hypothetical protein